MTTVETETPRKKGRPARYGQGRTSLHVRFTPERVEMLKTLADRHGRSLSEQVEFIVEDHGRVEELVAKLARSDAEEQDLLEQILAHQEQIGRHQQQIRKLKEENQKLKAEARGDGLAERVTALEEEGLAERVAALEEAMKGRKK
jgi:hypothetical protein